MSEHFDRSGSRHSESDSSFSSESSSSDSDSDHLESDHLESDHLESDHLESDHLESDHLESDHLESDHLESDHLESDHLDSDHLDSDLESDHLDSDHLDSDHLDSDHLESDHLESDHLESDHLESDHLESDHFDSYHSDSDHAESDHSDAELRHSCSLTNAIRSQLYNEETCDVVLIIENQRLYVHKLVLAARSTYFKALFYGGMKESKQSEIKLTETPAEAFKMLLEFAYSSQIELEKLKEDLLLDILELSRRYDFKELENGICKHLKNILSVTNICVIMDKVILYQIPDLMEDCLTFADRNAKEILKEESFLSLSLATMNKILVRDSFDAKEIDIFRAVCKWIELQNQGNAKDELVHIRLPDISVANLVEDVWSSNLIPQTMLLSAIKARVSMKIK